MAMLSPVVELSPWRTARLQVAKFPKPAIGTFSPRASASAMVANTSATTRSGSAPGTEVHAATLDVSSLLLMTPQLPQDRTTALMRLRARVQCRRTPRNGGALCAAGARTGVVSATESDKG